MKSKKIYKYNLILDLSKFDYFKLTSSNYFKIIYVIKSIDIKSFDYISIIYNSKIVSKEYLEITFNNLKSINVIYQDLINQSLKNSIIQINEKISFENIISILFLNNSYFINQISNFKFIKINIDEILLNNNKKILNNKTKLIFYEIIFFELKDKNITSYLFSLDRNYNYFDISLLEEVLLDEFIIQNRNSETLKKIYFLRLESLIFFKTLSENFSFLFGILFYFIVRFISFFYKNKYKKNNKLMKVVSFYEIIINNINIIRWGDGESSLLFGRSIYFQRSSIKLQFKLIKLILTHRRNINRFRLVYPSFSKERIWNLTNNLRYFINNINFSPFYFRENAKEAISIINNNLDLFSNIIYVGNESPVSIIKHDFLFHFKTNSANCFDQEKQILKYLIDFIEFLENNKKSNKRFLILFGCGPLSKLLIEQLSFKYPSHQFIDTGHLMMVLKI